jgi:O-acetyl-ADP-ribose deacetylase (regulator of RNase III)/transcriptional regulator with XRE-family HTH domain
MNVDAVVNAANTSLQVGGGVCGAIFNAAGAGRLQRACDKHAPIEIGDAIITKGFALSAKYIIHAAGPIYRDGKNNEEKLLRSCYKAALDIAKKHKCESMAFPLISSGIYGYPKDEALTVATSAISEWLMKNDMDVSLVVFDKMAFALSNELLGEVKAFIDENYVDEREAKYSRSQILIETQIFDFKRSDELLSKMPTPVQQAPQITVAADKSDKFINRLDESFSTTLLRLIDAKDKTDVEIYKRANLDRKLFSKIRTGKGYMPSKKTAVALAVALELSLAETRDLLERAGFALSRSVMFDVIIEYFITRRKYDIFEINNVLFEYDQQLLGG